MELDLSAKDLAELAVSIAGLSHSPDVTSVHIAAAANLIQDCAHEIVNRRSPAEKAEIEKLLHGFGK